MSSRPDRTDGSNNREDLTMALVRYVPTAEAAESIRPQFEKIESRGHSVPNFLRTLAHSPGLLEAFIASTAP